jgi:hypothetical protein
MRILLSVLVISSVTLAGCSGWRDSAVNPRNWFGAAESRPTEQAAAEAEANPLIPERTGILQRKPEEETYAGTLVDQITKMSVEPSGGGAIVKVTGRTLRQGAFDVRLVPTTEDAAPVDGQLTLLLKAVQPADTPQGPPRTRQVHAGRFVSNPDLRDIRTIRVVSARNVLTSRR